MGRKEVSGTGGIEQASILPETTTSPQILQDGNQLIVFARLIPDGESSPILIIPLVGTRPSALPAES